MKHNLTLIKLFYGSIWGNKNKYLVNLILHKDLNFKGSLGITKSGHDGFISYLDSIHKAFSDYKCIITNYATKEDKVTVKVRFSGIHKANFRGFSASGKKIYWDGIGHFQFDNKKIKNIAISSDIKELDKQLLNNSSYIDPKKIRAL